MTLYRRLALLVLVTIAAAAGLFGASRLTANANAPNEDRIAQVHACRRELGGLAPVLVRTCIRRNWPVLTNMES